jgi:hypothetical protein
MAGKEVTVARWACPNADGDTVELELQTGFYRLDNGLSVHRIVGERLEELDVAFRVEEPGGLYLLAVAQGHSRLWRRP